MSDAKYAEECLAINQSDLQAEFVRYTADLGYWGMQFAAKKQDENLAKIKRDVTAAELDVMAREALMGDKKPTEGMVSAWVIKHPAMQEVEKDLHAATYESDKVRAIWDAMRAKRDMLVGLGAQQRAEMQRDPQINTVEF